MFNLLEKVAIVTGGANGIGAQIIKEFVKGGVKYVAILDIDVANGTKLENEISAKYGERRARFFKCDITRDDQLFDIFEKVLNEFGNIDLVVNNAGIARDNIDMYKKEIEINFTASVTSTLKAIELMRADQGGKGGTVINISSVAALSLLSPCVFVYGATKSAILHFSNCIGKDVYYRHTKVRVITMCFSLTDTEILPAMDSFDDIINEELKQLVDTFHRQGFIQSSEIAAKGVVEAYNNGESGSTWLVDNNKITNITDDVLEGYKSISKQTTVSSILP